MKIANVIILFTIVTTGCQPNAVKRPLVSRPVFTHNEREQLGLVAPNQLDSLSTDEKRAIEAASNALEGSSITTKIMGFKVTKTASGWEVYVQYIGGYYKGEPIPATGSFNLVQLDRTWHVIRILDGA